jgi:hypothetical protein
MIIVFGLAVVVFFVFIITWLSELLILALCMLIVLSSRLLLMLFPRLPRVEAALHMLLGTLAL